MNTPICKMLSEHSKKNYTKFHTGSRDFDTPDFWSWDFTELPGLDNLQCPSGSILEAQTLAAQAFGADRTFFSVNGSTAAIVALIIGSCSPGDVLVVDRCSHRSVFHALALAGVKAVLVNPTSEDGLPVPQSAEVFLDATIKHEAVGVLVTRPNYYGISFDISELATELHKVGKFLLVDEAHGAHFGFHPLLPQAALKFGADGVAQSAHKTLGALNQTAYLHIQGSYLIEEKIASALSMVQTTSPSYPLLASLDYSRAWLQEEGESRYSKLLLAIDEFWKQLHPPFRSAVVSCEQDPSRLVIRMKDFDGNRVAHLLRERYEIQVEMSDTEYIVCIAVPGDEEGLRKLSNALNKVIALGEGNYPYTPVNLIGQTAYVDVPIDIRLSLYARHLEVEAQDAVGKISGEFVTQFPPGVPLLCPGEKISLEVATQIYDIIKSKITIMDDGGTND